MAVFSSSHSALSYLCALPSPDYESRLRARRIYCMRKTIELSNLREVKAALAATRESPEPDDATAENFPRRVLKSGNEGGAMQALLL